MAAGRLHGTRSPLGLGDTGGVLDRVPLMEGDAQGVSLTGLTPPGIFGASPECPAFSRDSGAQLFAALPLRTGCPEPSQTVTLREWETCI